MSRRAAVYARISPTPGEGAGWQRQLVDCQALIAERGWELIGEYVDRDTSAYRRKRRPEWERMLTDLDSGLVDALVVYHPDRAYRRGEALEALIDVVERRGVEVATVRAGDIDLSTATGRMGARIVAAVSQHESERMGERVARAKKERAAQGRPPGGGYRAFGWAADKVTLIPKEARAIQAAAERVAAGGAMGEEARRLNLAGFTTTAGKPWDSAALRRVLISPRIAGLRSYKGVIVGPAVWPPIITEELHHRLVVMVEGRKRGRRSAGQYLLTALIACPKCKRNMYGNGKDYTCAPSTRHGCGGASVAIHHADAAVIEAIDRWLDDPRLPAWIEQGARGVDLSAELDAIAARRVDMARRWAQDKMTSDAWDAATAILDEREQALAGMTALPASIPNVNELRQAWKDGTTQDRRVVVQALIETPIPLAPGKAEKPGDRLTITFR